SRRHVDRDVVFAEEVRRDVGWGDEAFAVRGDEWGEADDGGDVAGVVEDLQVDGVFDGHGVGAGGGADVDGEAAVDVGVAADVRDEVVAAADGGAEPAGGQCAVGDDAGDAVDGDRDVDFFRMDFAVGELDERRE